MSAPPAGGAAGGAAPTAAESSEEEQVLAACRDGDARGMSQDQLVAALPSIHVLRVSECLNSLLTKARGRAAAALRRSRAAAAPQGRIQVYSAAGAPEQTPVFKFVKPEEAVKCAGGAAADARRAFHAQLAAARSGSRG